MWLVDKWDKYNNSDWLDKKTECDWLEKDNWCDWLDKNINYDWLDNNNDCVRLVMEDRNRMCKLIIRSVWFRLWRMIKNEFVVIERNKWKVAKMINGLLVALILFITLLSSTLMFLLLLLRLIGLLHGYLLSLLLWLRIDSLIQS